MTRFAREHRVFFVEEPVFGAADRRWRRCPDRTRTGCGGGCGRPGADASSPAFAPDVVNVALDLMLDGEKGAWHLANPGLVSAPAPEDAPAYAILGTERGVLMPTLEDVHARLAERAIVPTEESAVERAG